VIKLFFLIGISHGTTALKTISYPPRCWWERDLTRSWPFLPCWLLLPYCCWLRRGPHIIVQASGTYKCRSTTGCVTIHYFCRICYLYTSLVKYNFHKIKILVHLFYMYFNLIYLLILDIFIFV
jgi:hypothetical protein